MAVNLWMLEEDHQKLRFEAGKPRLKAIFLTHPPPQEPME
jgi:hypothetical protein